MSEPPAEVAPAADAAPSSSATVAEEPAVAHQYWLRVHGYPSDLSSEVVYYHDFVDLRSGWLPGDPRQNLHPNDVFIYYADGPAIVYGVATITGEVEGPFPDVRLGARWTVPIRRDAIIKSVDKAPTAATLAPPSGRHFLRLVRDAIYIRLPEEDGEYLIAEVKSRAGTRASE